MYFHYFAFDTQAPAVRVNLAKPEYCIEKVIYAMGFEPIVSSLYIGRRYFQFLSEKNISVEQVGLLNQRLLQNEFVRSLCRNLGASRDNGRHFVKQQEFSCYAIIENYDCEDPTDTVAELQVFNKEDVAPLFTDLDYWHELEDGSLRNAIHAYRNYGISSREFQLAKLDYLDTLPCTGGRCSFPDSSWHFYTVGLYYRIDVCIDNPTHFNRKIDTAYEGYGDLNEDGIIPFLGSNILNGSCLLHTGAVSLPFQELFAPVDTAPADRNPESLKAFGPNSTFNEALVCDVGQALTVMLCDNSVVQGFFDLGLPNAFNKRYFPHCNAVALAVQNIITAQNPSTVILSHIHTDHMNLAIQVPASWSLDWYIPAGFSTPTFAKLNRLILTNGGSVTILTSVSIMPNFGQNLNIHKISTPGSYLPHYNGLFAELSLPSGNALLAGDCIYSAVSATTTLANYEYLQASHHGGVYYRTAATRNVADIPAPTATGQVIYSYSTPNTHHHPSHVADHTGQGWNTRLDTPTAPPIPALGPNMAAHSLT